MKRLLCLCLLLLATPATGAVRTYHVGIGGSNANTGVTYAQRWATVDRANEVVNTSILGTDYDILVKLYPADSTRADTAYNLGALPNPVNPATGGKRYYYRAAKLHGPIPWGNPNVSVSGGTLSKDYVSIRGVKFLTGLMITGKRDSVVGCVGVGSLDFQNAYYDVVNGSRFHGVHCWLNGNNPNVGETRGCEISDSHFPNLSANGDWGCCGEGCAQGTHGFWTEKHVDSCFFYRNRFNVKSHNLSVANATVKIKNCKNSIFRGNRFDIEIAAECGNEEGFYLYMRDSTIANVFRADTFFVRNLIADGGQVLGMIFGSGNNPTESCKDLTIDSCYFKLNRGETIWMNQPIQQWTVTNSIFFNEDGHAFMAPGVSMRGRNTFDHNTFVGHMPPVWLGYNCWAGTPPPPCTVNSCCDGCRTDDNTAGATIFGTASVDTNIITSNIFVNTFDGHIVQTNYNCDKPFATFYQGNGITLSTFLLPDWNLYYTASYKTTPGDGCIGWKDGGGFQGSAPGDNTPFETAFPNKDRRSSYGDPYLGGVIATQITYDNFQPWVGVLGAAKTAGKSGTTAGAVAYVGAPRVSMSGYNVKFHTSDPGYTSTVTLIVSNSATAGSDLEITDPGMGAGDTYLDWYFSKTTIAAGDTAALVISLSNAPTSGSGNWMFSFLTNDPEANTVQIPISFRSSRRRGTIDP